ncbi:Ankyrin repeat-containing protein [Tenacibaculum sp. MAR_2009_124]|uniref:ankyrin repeat domain-containing protein n=1 Tax=Tenacibaculum sp. MAR_2009_124 TaxID=1250059 RepID=UPI000894DEDA|nr:ankyrin repeat domain-containing protein [Tenacibaculum sp. MAR_2009_124]SEC54009.1 Ankyrin repeat-containing protein [Tenacibaculum sp. MAR_2009_124]
MKKFVLASFVILLSLTSVSASNSKEVIESTRIEYEGLSTFCKMIRSGNYETVKAFINNGTNINRKSLGLTPAMYAARYNKVEILKLLIENGAKLNIKSSKGYTALEYAKMSKANDAYTVLKEAMDKK